MKLFRTIHQIPEKITGSVVALGNFDGVHLGHQALLKTLRQVADRKGLPLYALLFEPQPSEFLHPEKALPRLSSLREKLAFLSNLSVDGVFCLRFNENLAKMKAEAFAEKYLFSALKAKYILVGEDFRFGYQREGDISLLHRMGMISGCQVEVFPDFFQNDTRISSTAIRQALSAGNLTEAKMLLGRPYQICGRVVKGQGLGRQWGIPTANILLNRKKLPLKGVFCVQVVMENQRLNAVANIGKRPTVDGTKTVLEVHIPDFQGCLYGKRLEIVFLDRLRDETRFASVEDLIAQIHIDIQMAKQFFNSEYRETNHG